jgi:hypothetical protein
MYVDEGDDGAARKKGTLGRMRRMLSVRKPLMVLFKLPEDDEDWCSDDTLRKWVV